MSEVHTKEKFKELTTEACWKTKFLVWQINLKKITDQLFQVEEWQHQGRTTVTPSDWQILASLLQARF